MICVSAINKPLAIVLWTFFSIFFISIQTSVYVEYITSQLFSKSWAVSLTRQYKNRFYVVGYERRPQQMPQKRTCHEIRRMRPYRPICIGMQMHQSSSVQNFPLRYPAVGYSCIVWCLCQLISSLPITFGKKVSIKHCLLFKRARLHNRGPWIIFGKQLHQIVCALISHCVITRTPRATGNNLDNKLWQDLRKNNQLAKISIVGKVHTTQNA